LQSTVSRWILTFVGEPGCVLNRLAETYRDLALSAVLASRDEHSQNGRLLWLGCWLMNVFCQQLPPILCFCCSVITHLRHHSKIRSRLSSNHAPTCFLITSAPDMYFWWDEMG